MSGPCWISLEGIEGSGKSTQVERLVRLLSSRGIDPVVTREPGGTDLGRHLRAILLHPTGPSIDPTAELLLYAADRAQHLAQVVLPALAQGRVVVCDRFLDATVAYQGYGRGLGVGFVEDLHRHPPLDRRPDRTLLLDLDVEAALTRARHRNSVDGTEQTEGRFEQEELDFHRRVRNGYLKTASRYPERIRIVDAAGTADEVQTRMVSALDDLLFGDEEAG